MKMRRVASDPLTDRYSILLRPRQEMERGIVGGFAAEGGPAAWLWSRQSTAFPRVPRRRTRRDRQGLLLIMAVFMVDGRLDR